jgi:hypothetical protein
VSAKPPAKLTFNLLAKMNLPAPSVEIGLVLGLPVLNTKFLASRTHLLLRGGGDADDIITVGSVDEPLAAAGAVVLVGYGEFVLGMGRSVIFVIFH